MIKLSNRLLTIANYVTPNNRVADIGSDHALLPVYLLQTGICPFAVAGELNAGPLLAAKKQASDAGLTNKLDVRQGNGLAVLHPGETDTVTIAGMGGSLMRDILESGFADGKLQGVTELVLQPNVGEDVVRDWLLNKGWCLSDESILEEDGKIYEVLRATWREDAQAVNESLYDGAFLGLPWETSVLKSILIRMGPHLLRSPSAALIKKWQLELQKLQRISDQLSESELPESAVKRDQFRAEMGLIKEVLGCLSTEPR